MVLAVFDGKDVFCSSFQFVHVHVIHDSVHISIWNNIVSVSDF